MGFFVALRMTQQTLRVLKTLRVWLRFGLDAGFLSDGFNICFPNPLRKILPDFMKSEAAFGHFPNRLFFGPSLNRNPIYGAYSSGAVCAVLAMDKDRGAFRICHNLKKAHNVLSFNMPSGHRDIFVPQTGVSDFVFVRMIRAEIDDCFDAFFLQIFHALRVRLRAAVKIVADFMQVGNAFERDRLRPRLRALGWGISLRDKIRQKNQSGKHDDLFDFT